MNGRLVPAMFAVALVLAIRSATRDSASSPLGLGWVLTGQALAALLASVSSGTFAVVAGLIVWSWVGDARRLLRGWLGWSAVVIGFLGLGAGVAFLGHKALRFFADDAWAVLGHGAGVFVLALRHAVAEHTGHMMGNIAGILAILGWCGFLFWWCVRGQHSPRLRPLDRAAIALPLALGLFGWATLTLALPGLVLAGLMLLYDERTTARA
jgi:hypothetical protein